MALINPQGIRETGSSTTIASAAWTAVTGNSVIALIEAAETVSMSLADGVNTYTEVSDGFASTPLVGAGHLFVAQNITGGSLTLTGTYGSAATFRHLILVEVNGVLAASVDDASSDAKAQLAASSITSNTFSTVAADSVIVSIAMTGNLAQTFTAGLIGGAASTLAFTSAAGDAAIQSLTVAATQSSITSAISAVDTQSWLLFTVALKLAGTGHPTMRRWGGVRHMGGQGIGQKGSGGGRMWGRHSSGIIVPRRLQEAA